VNERRNRPDPVEQLQRDSRQRRHGDHSDPDQVIQRRLRREDAEEGPGDTPSESVDGRLRVASVS
jgi:hypothetical protein